MSSASLQRVAFLDTNVLHYISLYLTRAEDRGLFPLGGALESARRHLRSVQEGKLREHLGKGLNLIDHLLVEGCKVEYSPASEIELLVGRARGRAIEKAAREGIPDRIWGKFSEEDINDRLEEADLTHIRSAVANIGGKLDAAGIDATAIDERRTNDALELARSIVGCIYIGVVDSVIYANALITQADHLVSDDGYFSATINRLRSGNKRFREIGERVVARVAELSLANADDVTLPDAPKWTKRRVRTPRRAAQ